MWRNPNFKSQNFEKHCCYHCQVCRCGAQDCPVLKDKSLQPKWCWDCEDRFVSAGIPSLAEPQTQNPFNPYIVINECDMTKANSLLKELDIVYETQQKQISLLNANAEHNRKLLYKIKYTILTNNKLSDSEKIAQLTELFAHECPHGANGSI